MSKEVVIIDDEEINLIVIQEILSNFKELEEYKLTVFDKSLEALDYCVENAERVEVILLDQYMPELTGIEFLEKYNQNIPANLRASTIMISTEDSSKVISEALNKGVDDFFLKPFNSNIMRARIRNSLDKNELRRKINEGKKLKEILIRVLIHDILSPLNIVMLLTKRISKESPNKRFSDIETSLKAVTDIIDSVKEVEALESEKKKLNLTKISALSLAEEVINFVEQLSNEKGVNIVINNNVEDATVTSDNGILKYQILANLLTNSIKFSEEGGTIEVNIDQKGENTSIAVRDYGVGIPETILKNLFKWDAKTTRKGTNNEKGTGFGMPIVKEFIEHLGHAIHVESWTEDVGENKRGTQITITFPQ